jgi:Omp85 superfamily domain
MSSRFLSHFFFCSTGFLLLLSLPISAMEDPFGLKRDSAQQNSKSNSPQANPRPPEVPSALRPDDYLEDRNQNEGSNIPGVGKELKLFGEEVASRIDKVVSRKGFKLWGDPWTIQGIPLIFPSPNNGFHLGLHAKLVNIVRQDPHQVEFMGQVLASDKGRYKHFFQADYPYALNGLYRITSRISFNQDITQRYYGMGNDTTVNPVGLEADNPLYANQRTAPAITLQILRYMGHNMRTGPVLGFKWMTITAPPGSLLASENPLGSSGGRTHYFGWAIVRDTLDFEPYPSRGTLNELYLQWYSKYSGSNYDFLRTTYTFRYYYPLSSKLIFAHRTFFEVLSGTVPFYELSAAGGSDSTIGFGGDRFMRGYDGNRFVDHIRSALGIELRWDPIHFGFANQEIQLGFVPFVDVGRVWNKLLPVEIGNLHASTGWGTRIIWGKRLIVRGDYALTPEGSSFYIELGNSF